MAVRGPEQAHKHSEHAQFHHAYSLNFRAKAIGTYIPEKQNSEKFVHLPSPLLLDFVMDNARITGINFPALRRPGLE